MTETILVVEDDEELASLFEQWLSADYTVRLAHNGEQALSLLDDEVDYVLLDRRMPGMSGQEVLAEINARGSEARVAMVTAVDPDYDILEMGFDTYLVKPVRRNEVLAAIDELAQVSLYDSAVQEYYALVAKKAALEESKLNAELQSNAEYQELLDRLAAVRKAADEQLTSIEDDEPMFSQF